MQKKFIVFAALLLCLALLAGCAPIETTVSTAEAATTTEDITQETTTSTTTEPPITTTKKPSTTLSEAELALQVLKNYISNSNKTEAEKRAALVSISSFKTDKNDVFYNMLTPIIPHCKPLKALKKGSIIEEREAEKGE